MTDDRRVAYISICRGPAIFTCQIHAVRVVLTDNVTDIRVGNVSYIYAFVQEIDRREPQGKQ